MRNLGPIRFAVTASVAFSTLLSAQTQPAARKKPSTAMSTPATSATLPPTPPTTIPAVPRTPGELPAHPASVTYANGLLTVIASNSSLNQILRDVSRETSMKVTGGVIDERVFGQYGPAPVGQILNTLLDGTGSNMLLVESNGVTPAELILTPQSGGPSPPNPNAAAAEEGDQSEDQPGGKAFEGVSNPPEAAAPEPTPPQQQQSPNAVKTPQQIYDQLQKLRQQQAQQPSQPQ